MATAYKRIEVLEVSARNHESPEEFIAPSQAPPPPPPPPAPPLAGGVPRPPPPPPPVASLVGDRDIFTKLGMKRKKKWAVEGKLKRTNWKVVQVKDVTERAIWSRLDEERLASPDLIVKLEARFGSKASVDKLDDSRDQQGQPGRQGSGRRFKDLKFLDSKVAQNLSVVLGKEIDGAICNESLKCFKTSGGSLKHISYTDFRSCILNCDTRVLTESLLQTLILVTILSSAECLTDMYFSIFPHPRS